MKKPLLASLGLLILAVYSHAAELDLGKGSVLFGGALLYGSAQRVANATFWAGTVKAGRFITGNGALEAEIGYGRHTCEGQGILWINGDEYRLPTRTYSDQYIRGGVFADRYWKQRENTLFFRGGLGVITQYTAAESLSVGISPRIGVVIPFSKRAAYEVELGYQKLLTMSKSEALYISLGLTGFSK